MNCAKCPHGYGHLLEWAREHPEQTADLTDEERATIRATCLRCNPDAAVHKGVSHVYAGTENVAGGEGAALKIDRSYLARLKPTRERATPLPARTEDALLELLERFRSLEPFEVCILHALLNGATISEIGPRLGYNSRAAAHAALKSLLKRHPWVRSIHLRGYALGPARGPQTWREGKPMRHLPSTVKGMR